MTPASEELAAWSRIGTSAADGSDQRDGAKNMTATLGILALLEAKPGKGDELAEFLRAGRALAVAEPGTLTWYAFKISETRYGIFDTFETDDARTAHINGEIPKALANIAEDLLASAPSIQPVDVLAVK
jgi:quinol monooxygenase YgiN